MEYTVSVEIKNGVLNAKMLETDNYRVYGESNIRSVQSQIVSQDVIEVGRGAENLLSPKRRVNCCWSVGDGKNYKRRTRMLLSWALVVEAASAHRWYRRLHGPCCTIESLC